MDDAYKNYLTAVQMAKSFLFSQKEMYKTIYIDSHNDKYLQVMNDMNNTSKTIVSMDLTIMRQAKEISEFKKRIKELESSRG